MSITIYSTDGCQQCRATKTALDRKGIPYTEYNTSHDEQAANVARGLGYFTAPVVVVDYTVPGMAGEHWSGFRPDKIAQL